MAATNDLEPGELYTTEDSEDDDVIYPGNFVLFLLDQELILYI